MRTSSRLTLGIFGLLGACRPSSPPTPPAEPEPVADQAASEPEGAPDQAPAALAMPTLRGPYVQRRDYDESNGSAIFRRVVFDFEGSTVAVRYLMIFAPEGEAEQSTTRICAATVRVPVQWAVGGFTVETDATAESEAIVYDRSESPGEAEGKYVAHWTHAATSCSVILREGFYRLQSVSDVKSMDRPRTVVLARDDDRIELEVSDDDDEDKDFKRAVEGHFGRTPDFD